jgi:hypothetical protein
MVLGYPAISKFELKSHIHTTVLIGSEQYQPAGAAAGKHTTCSIKRLPAALPSVCTCQCVDRELFHVIADKNVMGDFVAASLPFLHIKSTEAAGDCLPYMPLTLLTSTALPAGESDPG